MCAVNEVGDGLIGEHMDVSPTSPDVEMVIGCQSFRDEVQTMIAQQMKSVGVPPSVPYAARGELLGLCVKQIGDI